MEERRHPVVENESVNASQKQEHATLVPVEHCWRQKYLYPQIQY